MTTYRLAALLLVIITITSCKDKVDKEAFSKEIRTIFTAEDSTKPNSGKLTADMYQLYSMNDFQPLWIDDKAKLDNAKKLLEEIKSLEGEGLSIEKYDFTMLNDNINVIEHSKGQVDTKQALDFEKLFTEMYITAAKDVMYGVLNPRKVTDMWYHDNDTSLNLKENYKEGFPSLEPFKSKHPTYKALVDYRKQAIENGNDSLVKVIDANLERLRWLPQDFEDEYVIVVVPRMEVAMMEKGKETMKMKVIVGKVSRETPSLNADMQNVVFNPSWGVPPGILKKDVIPGLFSNGEAYLDKKGLEIYDRQGNPVDASQVNKDNYDNYIFRQPPSERNALGQVKFDLPNPYAIYLHDTPHKELFDKDERAYSSGCIRVHEPRKLANYILSEMEDKHYTMDEINEIVSHNNTEYVKLEKRIPVHIIYLTAYKPSGGELEFYKDVYNKDHEIFSQLKS